MHCPYTTTLSTSETPAAITAVLVGSLDHGAAQLLSALCARLETAADPRAIDLDLSAVRGLTSVGVAALAGLQQAAAARGVALEVLAPDADVAAALATGGVARVRTSA